MRILRLIPYMTDAFGGPVRHVKMLTRELQDLGHESVVFTTNLLAKDGGTTRFENAEFDIRTHPVWWSVGDYFYTPGLKDALRKEQFDVVHAHCFRNYQTEAGAWIARKRGKPFVLTAHGTLGKLPNLRDRMLKGAYDAISRGRVLRTAAKTVALSEYEVAEYRAMGVPPERVVKIYHGIDTDRFHPEEITEGDGDSIERDAFPIVLYAGRIHRRKGIEYLVKAFIQLLRSEPHAQLVLSGPDYGHQAKLCRAIPPSLMGDRIVLTGQVDHRLMPRLYRMSDIVVLPARQEVFGHVLAEAAACGKAIVTTRWGWAEEFFEEGEDCMFLEDPTDIERLTKILEQLARDDAFRDQLGAAARGKVSRALSWRKCALQHERMYQTLLT